MTTRRIVGGEIRATSDADGQHTVELQAIKPGVVDDYGSVWMADTFDATLEERLPTLVWSHDWTEPIGHGIGFRASKQGPRVKFAFDDFDAVPRARQAFAQCQSGTIRDCSVGFSQVTRREPTEQETKRWPGVREVITAARMDELSLVLAGAVPGAKVLAVRMANDDAKVSREQVAQLLARLATGELTLTHALVELEALTPLDEGDGDADLDDDDPSLDDAAAEDDPEADPGDGDEPADTITAEDLDALTAELEDALALTDGL